MKYKILILIAGLSLICPSVFAQMVIDNTGYVGIGTTTPSSRLTVNGVIETTSGGIKFPDGSFQTTAGAGNSGSITSVNAGTGLTGGGSTGNVTVSISESYKLPQSCINNQIAKWNGTAWICTNNNSIAVESDPTVNSLGKAAITCTTDQIIKWDGANWVCSNDLKNLESRIAALEDLLDNVTRTGDDIYIDGANLHVRNGSGSTAETANGLGNIIIGYNEARAINIRSGSHNLIVGAYNDYSSYGGIVSGYWNSVSGIYSTAIGGLQNTANGSYSSVMGGEGNAASGDSSLISGGSYNTASGISSSLNGGQNNNSIGNYSLVSGGFMNSATGDYSAVNGGSNNSASSYTSTVNGGDFNEASGPSSAIIGGFSNKASGTNSSVSGGSYNTASGDSSSVTGGGGSSTEGNTAFGHYTAILGGKANLAGDQNLVNHNLGNYATISAGTNNKATGLASSVSGGSHNTAGGDFSSVTGGGGTSYSEGNSAFSHYTVVLGGKSNLAGDTNLTNRDIGKNATVTAGTNNKASGAGSTVSGGSSNTASHENSAISGGGGKFTNGVGQWKGGGSLSGY